MKKRLNIAYGSNLNLDQMALRCPTAKVYGKGMLENYKLLFKGTPGNAYATIEPDEGREVPVLVWEVQPEDEMALDFYEGFPNFYYKKDLSVKLESDHTVTAMVYIMTDKIKDRLQLNLPSERYLKIVKAGYISAGFDSRIIEAALKASKHAIKKESKEIL